MYVVWAGTLPYFHPMVIRNRVVRVTVVEWHIRLSVVVRVNLVPRNFVPVRSENVVTGKDVTFYFLVLLPRASRIKLLSFGYDSALAPLRWGVR